jgi:hypothetical protein
MRNKKAKRVVSWDDIPAKLFEKFEEMVYALRDRTIPRDGDDDTPVQIMVCNRLKYEPIHWFPVPNESTYNRKGDRIKLTEDQQDELDMERERMLAANLSTAAAALEQHFKLKQFRMQKRLEKKKPLLLQIKNACMLCEEGVGFEPPTSSLGSQDPTYPSYNHINGDSCKAFALRRQLWYDEKQKGKVTEL